VHYNTALSPAMQNRINQTYRQKFRRNVMAITSRWLEPLAIAC
jgi:hypothetical protein